MLNRLQENSRLFGGPAVLAVGTVDLSEMIKDMRLEISHSVHAARDTTTGLVCTIGKMFVCCRHIVSLCKELKQTADRKQVCK